MKKRFIALTDIYRLPNDQQEEIDDVQSMIRLLLYSDNIDIEGLIATSSFCYKKGGTEENKQVILDIIDGYEKVLPNLRIHSKDYPEASYLRSITKRGINEFGRSLGKGFGNKRYTDNEGTRLIMNALEKPDDRPLWFGLWGGCNTLAQAVWALEKKLSHADFECILKKIRIYAISDQDRAGIWLRQRYGDRLFYIVSPSSGSGNVLINGMGFMGATWTGMCWDTGKMSSYAKGFEAADSSCADSRWLKEHICGEGEYSRLYPLPIQAMEGDTPTYLGLIENGLNEMEHPDWGSWGGRYEWKFPEKTPMFAKKEKYPLWTDTYDRYSGNGVVVENSVCTLYRWREDFQHDFEARMKWAEADRFDKANHPPIARLDQDKKVRVKGGQSVIFDASASYDPDGDDIKYEWFEYPEAGTNKGHLVLNACDTPSIQVTVPHDSGTIHLILRVKDHGTPSLCSYIRIIIEVITE